MSEPRGFLEEKSVGNPIGGPIGPRANNMHRGPVRHYGVCREPVKGGPTGHPGYAGTDALDSLPPSAKQKFRGPGASY